MLVGRNALLQGCSGEVSVALRRQRGGFGCGPSNQRHVADVALSILIVQERVFS